MRYAVAPYGGPKEVKYLFVDAGCLRAVLRKMSERYFEGVEIQLNHAGLKAEFTKAFYYDAWPAKKPDQSDAEYDADLEKYQARIERIAETDGWHFAEGEAIHRKRRGLEQKKVDIMIAVDMMRHAFRGNMHRATLMTSDLDFKPLLDALVSEGMYVTLWYPPAETSSQLARSADARRHLDVAHLAQYVAPEFLESRPLPQSISGQLDRSRLTLLHRGLSNDGRELTVFRDESDGETVLAARQDGHADSFTQVRHRQWPMVVKWLEDVHRMHLGEGFAGYTGPNASQ